MIYGPHGSRLGPKRRGKNSVRNLPYGPRTRLLRGNIALLKPTDQSSTSDALISSNAVDGVNNSHIDFCTHTTESTDPWWRADLQSEQPVAEVRILNRGNPCCADKLKGAEIRVGNSDANGGAANRRCDRVTSIQAGQEKSYFCIPRAYGRYVYIRIRGSGKTLTLCEVEVYSTYISRRNLALSQPALQISTAFSGAASRAVDGGTSIAYSQDSCTHTTTTTDPWWRVDLGSSVPVTEVRIVNRGVEDCDVECQSRLNSFEIRIGNRNQSGGVTNPSCGGNLSLSVGQTKSFYCKPVLVGRFVFVRIPGSNKVLTLCEVQVYSTPQSVKGCSGDPVGISDSSIILDQRFSASSTRTGSNPYNGRLRNASNSWMPSNNNDASDFLQIDLGSVYFVCGVATQGNPNADVWTKTYKIETSLNNVNWTIYVENHVEKNFTGNSDKNSVVRSELYEPVAAKFIRFYPVLFHGNKALRVEVYGSLQDCLSSIGNERFVVRTLGTTASSELDANHNASWSGLYGLHSWCSASVSLPQYLQFDAKKVITVSGVATQGDNVLDIWVTSYAISYGYDGQKWFDYSGGRVLTGNINRGSIVVNFLSSPFAAQYIRILPKTYKTGICMRVDLLVCDNFQAPFLFVQLEDAVLPASSGGSVVLSCKTLVSNQRPPAAYKWSKDGAGLSGSSSSFTIRFTNATDIINNYQCARKSSSVRDVECNATYQCSTSLVDLPQIKDHAKGNVTVILRIPEKPVARVNQGDVQARSAVVRWTYSPAADEVPIDSFTLHYQNNTFEDFIILCDGSVSRRLDHLKPYTRYSVRVKATSVWGTGNWSNPVNFTTSAATPIPPDPREPAPDLTVTDLPVNVTVWAAPQDNGPISYYQVLVHLVEESTDTVSDWTKLGSDLYIAAQIPSGDVNQSLVFALGDGNEYGGFVNKDLSSGQKYNIYSWALTFKLKKRSTEHQVLVSEAVLIAKIEVKKDLDDQSEKRADCNCERSTNSDCNTILYLVSIIVLAVLLVLSVGWNVYLCRARRTSNIGEKYSADEESTEGSNRQVIDNVQPPDSNYMELRPTQPSHVTDHQYMNTMSQNQPLNKRKGKKNPSVTYENVNLQLYPVTNDHEADVYEEIIA